MIEVQCPDEMPRIIWSQTQDTISICIMTSNATSCCFYPQHLVLSPVSSPHLKLTMRFYRNIDHQPLRLSVKHDHWRIVCLSKEESSQWPTLFDESYEHSVDILYNDEFDFDRDEDDTIDFDKVVSSHGNKTGLEM